MKLISTLKVIERVDRLIHRKATGKPTELARRLNLSERSIYNIIETMKTMGAPIYYDRNRGSYCYEEDVRFKFGFYCQKSQMRELYGGGAQRMRKTHHLTNGLIELQFFFSTDSAL